jgi:hypothetical protein
VGAVKSEDIDINLDDEVIVRIATDLEKIRLVKLHREGDKIKDVYVRRGLLLSFAIGSIIIFEETLPWLMATMDVDDVVFFSIYYALTTRMIEMGVIEWKDEYVTDPNKINEIIDYVSHVASVVINLLELTGAHNTVVEFTKKELKYIKEMSKKFGNELEGGVM